MNSFQGVLPSYMGKGACPGPYALESPALDFLKGEGPGSQGTFPPTVTLLFFYSMLQESGLRNFLAKWPAFSPMQASFLVCGVWVKVGLLVWGAPASVQGSSGGKRRREGHD